MDSSLIALRGNARTIAGLSVGLAMITALAVGFAVSAAVAIPLAAAIALGAVGSPPDPVAATVGGGFSVGSAVGQFLLSAAGGLAAGLAVAAVVRWIRQRLDDPLAENTLSLATPYAAYLFAEEFHVSGVLAVVVAGLWLGHSAPTLQSSQSRLQTRAVWRLVEYLLEGFVFLLIGQQLPAVLRGLGAYSTRTVLIAAALTVGVVLLVRPLWLVITARLPARLHARLGGDPDRGAAPLSRRELLALSWAGTRGVISLAAAFSLPLHTTDGAPFPGRNLVLFCTYLVVLVTLLGQGLTFAPLLRRLQLGSGEVDTARVRNEARVAAVQASLVRLKQLADAEPQPEEIVGQLRRSAQLRKQRYSDRVTQLAEVEDDALPVDGTRHTAAWLRRAMIDAEREELLEWRDAGRLPDTSLRVLQRELDHEEGVLPPPPG